MRTFISVNIPEEIMQEIIKIQNKIPEFSGKKTEPENLHLTLKFLGEISEEKAEQVKESLREIKLKSFEAEIDSIGVFSEEYIRIIWLHFKGAEELQKIIDDKLKGLFAKEKRFMGHLTIARVKSIKDKRDFLDNLKRIKIKKMKFFVKNFRLKKSILTSNGPVYENLEVYSLG